MRHILTLIAVLTVSFTHLVSTAHATETTAISVSPAILESIVTPNQPNLTKVVVVNNTVFPLPIKSQVSAFLSNTSLPKSDEDTFNASSWFLVDPADFILQPMEKKEIIITIKPPKNTEPGGHYATIYFEPLIPKEVLSQETTTSLARIGVLSFLVVPGDIQESLEISDLTSNQWQTFGPLDFKLKLKNTGNIHLLPTGKIEIKNIFNKIVSTIPLNHETILPDSDIDQQLTWDIQLLFGRYTAKSTINYGNNHEPLNSNLLVFWIIPWPLIIIAFALLTLLYKIFIVHIDRVKLAIKVLKGQEVHEPQSIQENPPQLSSRGHRTHTSHSSSKRSHRRQSH